MTRFLAESEPVLTVSDAVQIIASMLVSHVASVWIIDDTPNPACICIPFKFESDRPPYRGRLIDWINQTLVDTDNRGRFDDVPRKDDVYIVPTEATIDVYFALPS